MAYANDILNLLAMHFGNYDENSNIGKILRILEYTDDQFLETAEDMKTILDLDQCFGKNLDLIHGKNKSLSRGSLSDADYIQLLKLETKVNNSQGTLEETTEIVKIIFGENSYDGIKENYEIDGDGARFQLKLFDITDPNTTIPNETFQRAIIAAVAIDYYIKNAEISLKISNTEVTININKVLETGTFEISRQLGVMF